MNKKNFDVVVDIGIEQITSCSFFKDSDTINYSNKFSFNKKDNLNFEKVRNANLEIQYFGQESVWRINN